MENPTDSRSIVWLCLSCGWTADCPMPGFAGSGGTEHRHFSGDFGCGPLIGLLVHNSHDFCKGTGIVLYAGTSGFMELRTCTCNPIRRTVGETRIPTANSTERGPADLRIVSLAAGA